MKFKLLMPAAFLFMALIVTGCKSESSEELDTPTTGKIVVVADETFSPVLDSEIATFESIYNYADIMQKYKPEAEVFADLLSDSTKVIITTRKLNKEEMAYFDTLKIIPHTVKIAYDAVALIVNPANRDTNLTMSQFRNIVSGKIKSWKQVNRGSALSDIQIIFDNPNSSTVRFLKDQVKDSLSKNSFAVKNNPSVIEYVAKNKNAIGVIGVNWISDRDDSVTNKFLGKIKVVGLATDSAAAAGSAEYFQPYQGYIAKKLYPLSREVYIISSEARAGLGSGLTAFISSDKGQRIILKAGLVPATAPIRLVELKEDNTQYNK